MKTERKTATYLVLTNEEGWKTVNATSPQAIREEYRAKGIEVLKIIGQWA